MYINAIGSYVPSIRITNDYFLTVNGLTDEWIQQRTGIRSRSHAGPGEDHNTMGLAAIRNALERLPYPVTDVDLIVSASYSPCDTVGTLAHVAQREFAIDGAKAVYASAACSSFINGLEIVEGYFAMGKATRALLICSEHNTFYSNPSDPKSGHLWGDAAVAYFLSADPVDEHDFKVVTVYTEGLGHIGKGPDGVKLRPKDGGITMPDGRDVFIHACRYMVHALQKALEQCSMTTADMDYYICHQANKRIVVQVENRLDVPAEKFLNNIEELGNTGSASAPLVLAQHQDELKKGQRAALMVFGGGYSCGCFIVEKI